MSAVSAYHLIKQVIAKASREAGLADMAGDRDEEHAHVMQALGELANAQEMLEGVAKLIERARERAARLKGGA